MLCRMGMYRYVRKGTSPGGCDEHGLAQRGSPAGPILPHSTGGRTHEDTGKRGIRHRAPPEFSVAAKKRRLGRGTCCFPAHVTTR